MFTKVLSLYWLSGVTLDMLFHWLIRDPENIDREEWNRGRKRREECKRQRRIKLRKKGKN